MSVQVDFDVIPAKAKCDKCLQEEEIPATGVVLEFVEFMATFEGQHKDCT